MTATSDDFILSREAGIEAMCITLLKFGGLLDELGLPVAKSIKRQVRLGNSLADIVIDHGNGTITLIEVKCPGLGLRDYCTGIGQLAYYAVMAMIQLRAKTVNRYLAVPGPCDLDLILMCSMSDIEIIPLPTMHQWSGIVDEASRAAAH